MSDQRLYRIADVCRLTSRSRTTVYADQDAGLLEYTQIGQRRYFTDDQIDAYVRRLTARPSHGVDRILALVADDGTIDVDRLPADVTLGDLREAQRQIRARATG